MQASLSMVARESCTPDELRFGQGMWLPRAIPVRIIAVGKVNGEIVADGLGRME